MSFFHQDTVIKEFEELTKDVMKVQIETLQMILEENGEAEYLQNLGLGGRTNPASFKACVPLVHHHDIEGHIRRIADGESSSILTGKPITSMSLREFPLWSGKALHFFYGSKQVRTAGGIAISTVTSNLFRSEQLRCAMKDIQSLTCSSPEVIFASSFDQSLYCHLLCGLISYQEVHCISATFAYSIVQAFRTLELLYDELCADIRHGVLSSKITDPSMRAAVSKLLTPNPDLADAICKICQSLNNWFGVIPMLWPNAKYVYGIMTGSMEPYVKKLRHYAKDLPLVCYDYGASEGWIGVNVTPKLPPEEVKFVVYPNLGYFEFIPVAMDNSDGTAVEPEPIGLDEIELGKEYELIITNFAGLYRYRLGDVVRVGGFYNSSPALQFVSRHGIVLNITVDKTTERDVQLAVEEASKLLAAEKLEVVDFSSCVERSPEPGHYVIFWELSGMAKESVLRSCVNCLDLFFIDVSYVSSRMANAIGPLELRIVRRGTFRMILENSINYGASASQFKNPRLVPAANVSVLRIINDNVIDSYLSSAYN